MTSNAVKTNGKELGGMASQAIYEEQAESQTSQEETSKEFHLTLSLETYGSIARRALQEGCTVEELIARQIEQITQR